MRLEGILNFRYTNLSVVEELFYYMKIVLSFSQDEDDYSSTMQQLGRKSQYTAPLNILNDMAREEKVWNEIIKRNKKK